MVQWKNEVFNVKKYLIIENVSQKQKQHQSNWIS